MRMRKILVINGPNLDMLGTREPEIYGRDTLETLENEVVQYGARRGVEVKCFQSNSEGELVEKIHSVPTKFDGIVYNPGAHTHYSYALRDAIGSIDTPVVEVHLSDINDREPFRQVSVIAPVCIAQVKGLGIEGYLRAIDILCQRKKRLRLGNVFEQVTTGVNVITAAELDDLLVSREKGSSKEAAEQEAAPAVAEPAACAKEATPARDEDADPRKMLLFGGAAKPERAAKRQVAPEAGAVPESVAQLAQQLRAKPHQPSRDQLAQQQVRQPASQSQVQPRPQPALQPQRQPTRAAAYETPVNYADAYAGAVAAVDAGLLSFERQGVVRRACDRLGVSSLLVRDTSNIRWITALDDVFDEERAHALLIAGGRAFLHTDSRYVNAVRSGTARIGSDIVVNDERVSHAKFAYNVLTQNGTAPIVGKLGIEDTIDYAEFVKMVECFKTDFLAPTSEVVLGLRAVKDMGEITRLRAAQAITDAAFTHIISYIRPGMTERDVQLELEDFMVRHGAEGLAFRSIVATGPNGADPHAVPGSARLEAGQCVVMDFGAKAYGYCSDMTRTVFLGRPQGAMAAAWETLRHANETVEAMLKPGVTGAAAHEMVERILEESGFGGRMGHGLGHGVGLDVHELPTLNPRNKEPLVVGNVVTVEPGIYLPGKFGMRLEDFGVITETGFDVITQSTHEMVVI